MIRIVKEITVEVTKPNVFQALVAKQYDMNTRFLKVTLTDGGTPITVPYTDEITVVINAERKDGQSKGFDGVVNEDGTVTVPLHSWMLELDGEVKCDISVIDTTADNNKKLTTTSFDLIVEKAAYGGDDVTSDPQYDVLVELIEKVESLEGISIDQTYNPESENAQSGVAVAGAINGATEEVAKVVTDVYGEIDSLNDQRFAVYYTDKVLQITPKDQWLTFKQAFYACGYGGVTYGEGTYDNRPKIGDMLICRPNGYIYKVAGVQEESQTICAWFIASGTGDKEYAEKSYVDEKIATAGGGTADYTLIGSIDLNNGSIDINGQYKDILITGFSVGIMLGNIELTLVLSNGRTINATEYFDFSTYLSYFKFINDGGVFNIMCDRNFNYCNANMAFNQISLGASIKRITVKGYPESQDWGDGPVTTPFETAQVYAR